LKLTADENVTATLALKGIAAGPPLREIAPLGPDHRIIPAPLKDDRSDARRWKPEWTGLIVEGFTIEANSSQTIIASRKRIDNITRTKEILKFCGWHIF
jgi:hypothetical protein